MLAITPRVVRTNGPQTAIRRLLRPARVSVLVEALTRNLSAAPGAASASSPQGWSYYCVECLSPYARGRASLFPLRDSSISVGAWMLLDAWHIEFTLPPTPSTSTPSLACSESMPVSWASISPSRASVTRSRTYLVITGHQTAAFSSLVLHLAKRSAVWPFARLLRLAPAR